MKKYWLALIGMVLVLAVVGLAGCGTPASTGTQQQGIWVSGEGKVYVQPDLATLTLGISAQEASVAQAQSGAADAMNKVMAALSNAGIDPKDIQTRDFSIVQVTRWDDKSQEQVVIGYRVDNTVVVKVRALDKVGAIIDAVAEAGGDLTRIQGIDMSLEDPTAVYAQAREKAVADARGKAVQLAEQFGVKLGNLVYVTESQFSVPIMKAADGMTAGMESVRAPTPISPGELTVTLNVTAQYAIK